MGAAYMAVRWSVWVKKKRSAITLQGSSGCFPEMLETFNSLLQRQECTRPPLWKKLKKPSQNQKSKCQAKAACTSTWVKPKSLVHHG